MVVASGSVRVFAINQGGSALLQWLWTPATGWQLSTVATALQGTPFLSPPTALFDGSNIHVYETQSTGNQVLELPALDEFLQISGSSTWASFRLSLGSSAIGIGPVSAVQASSSSIQLFGLQLAPFSGPGSSANAYAPDGSVEGFADSTSGPPGGGAGASDLTTIAGGATTGVNSPNAAPVA